MTKQEQIEEMVVVIQNSDKVCVNCETPYCGICTKRVIADAEALYDAGYRIIREKNELKERNGLKAENRQLKTECALLDDELRIARQDTIDVLNKLKTKSYVNNYCREVVEVEKIDELIKELVK